MFVWPGFGMTAHLGPEVIAVIVLMASMAVALGHLMGRGATPRERASLATASVARNLGLAFVIASADGLLPELLPTLIAQDPDRNSFTIRDADPSRPAALLVG